MPTACFPQKLPNLIIGGAPRSGTTWLYNLLDMQSSIFMAKPVAPEPKFFLVDSEYKKGLTYYSEKWFANSHSQKIICEKSTNYLESPLAAKRIVESLPLVKLIFILRDPVARAVSNYFWSKMNGLEKEEFEYALQHEEERESLYKGNETFSRPYSYFSRGLYAKLLEPYFNFFPATNILCLKFEDITENPETFIKNIKRFLGTEITADNSFFNKRINSSKNEKNQIPSSVISELKSRYQKPNQELQKMLGNSFTVWLYE